MKTALISVYDKKGIAAFAKGIKDLGFRILASGGTAKVLGEAGIEVTDVASLVGGGAILGHRVVTLSREVHAGLLARDNDEDRAELEKLKIPFIDLVCVDLYPLAEEIAKPNSTLESVIEKTDIGGPTMLQSAAKGRRIVVCDPVDRLKVVDWLKSGEPERGKFITELCAKAEYIVADYALASARYLSAGKVDGIVAQQISQTKYGENAWQVPAGLFADADKSARYTPLSLANFQLMSGTEPSYNNWADVDRLLQTVTHIAAGFDINFKNVPSIAVGVKHGNPCGAAVGQEKSEVLKKMLEGDLRAIFGGVVMVNFEIDEELAEVLLSYKMAPTTPSRQGRDAPPLKGGEAPRRLLDGVIAPSFTDGAIEMLKRKGDKCRFLVNPALAKISKSSLDNHSRFRYVRGGFLMQPNYSFVLEMSKTEIIGELTDQQKFDLILAWAIGSTSNSNTVTIVKNNQLLGNGVGQQDRVSCCELAIKRAKLAKHDIIKAVAYSDSFFPFVDGPKTLAEAGISAIFATSGSVRDTEIKTFCKEQNICLVMLPDGEARGFFGH